MLPCLSNISVNACTQVLAADSTIDFKDDLQHIVDQLANIEAKRPRNDDKKLDDFWPTTKLWRKYYPQDPPLDDDQKRFKDFSNFNLRQSKDTMRKDAHWKQESWETDNPLKPFHETLKGARRDFADFLEQRLKDPTNDDPNHDCKELMGEIKQLIEEEIEMTQYSTENKKENKAKLKEKATKITRIYKQMKDDKKCFKNPANEDNIKLLPPGWIPYPAVRTTSEVDYNAFAEWQKEVDPLTKASNQGKTEEDYKKALGKSARMKEKLVKIDYYYGGPVWELRDEKDGEGRYKVFKSSSPTDAWFIYTHTLRIGKRNGRKGRLE